jgi:endo-1,4-beta-xylanase
MFGCAVYENHFNDVQYMNLVTLHCSVLVNENGFKWGIMESVRGEPDWSYLDRLLDIAKVNNRTVKLHNLFWHQQLPNWVNNLTSAELEDAMKRRIQYTAEKLTGIEHLIYGIDVVNEAVDELGLLRNSIFSQKIGIGWVEKAFTWTRQAFGDRVKLIYNDFNTEYGLLKTNSVYSITRDLKQKNWISNACRSYQWITDFSEALQYLQAIFRCWFIR